jgi:hypothetical protein
MPPSNWKYEPSKAELKAEIEKAMGYIMVLEQLRAKVREEALKPWWRRSIKRIRAYSRPLPAPKAQT